MLAVNRRVIRARSKSNKTATQKISVQTLRNGLSHRLKAFRTLQAVYMPCVSGLLEKSDSAPLNEANIARTPSKPEFEAIWMPSEVPQLLQKEGIATGLKEKEIRLREGEAESALHQVCGVQP